MDRARLVQFVIGVAVILVLAVGGLSLIFILAGGGDDADTPAANLNEGGDDDDSGTPGGDEDSAVDLGDRESGELRLPGPNPITLDPALVTDAGSSRYIVEIYGGLVGWGQDYELIPDLAESLPEAEENSDGSVSYTFTLRRNAVFHDGRPVTAEDVKYSLERSADPQTGSTVASIYMRDVRGALDKIRGRADEISGVEVIDDSTIRITLDEPRSYFLQEMTYPVYFVVDRNEAENDPSDFWREPNGTGPFELDNWDLNQQLVIVRNEEYHLEAPLISQATFVLAGSFLTLYEGDDIDLASIGITDIDRARDSADPLNEDLVETVSFDYSYIAFNAEEPPFDDPLVRKAFAQAIDKDALVEVVLRDLGVVANGLIPPGIPGFDEDFEGLAFDPEAAQATLEDSSYGTDLPRIVWTTPGQGATAGPIVEAIVEMIRENLGVDIEIEQVEYATFLQDLNRSRFQMFDTGWVADYPDPQNFIDVLFYSDSAQNDWNYANAEVDALIEEARSEPDLEVRIELYRQAMAIIVEEAPVIPLFHQKNVEVVKPYITGYEPPAFEIPFLRFIGIEN
ncbi:MAG: peptide ABC transporter substrate-binding protein [Dehalococcoidia bacterium]